MNVYHFPESSRSLHFLFLFFGYRWRESPMTLGSMFRIWYTHYTMQKANQHPPSSAPNDPFWTRQVQFFTAQFPAYYTTPQNVWGRFHTSEERYTEGNLELLPLKHRKGIRTYVMMQPYVREPVFTLTVGLYKSPKRYADQDSAIGKTLGNPKQQGFREVQIGNAQAWYYHEERTIMLWECFFDSRFHTHPFLTDTNMQKLWQSFERWLRNRFPQATTLATPFSDPIAHSREEYQAFLACLGYSRFTDGVFAKTLIPPSPAPN